MTAQTLYALALAYGAPLVKLILGGIAAAVALAARKYLRDKRLAANLAALAYGAADVVADFAQHVVTDLKDPAKPGTWDAQTAAAVKLRAVAMLRELHPLAVGFLTEVLKDPALVDAKLAAMVERAVVDLKAAQSPKPAAAVAVAGDVGTVNVAPPAPYDPQATVHANALDALTEEQREQLRRSDTPDAGPAVRRALLAALALAGCPDSQHDPAVYGVVLVYVDTGWLQYDRARIRDALRNLGALGPAFVETSDVMAARVILRPYQSPSCDREAGRHVLGTRVAEVDPVCAAGDGAFRAMVGHEVGHVLGMLHVCERTTDGPTCSPVVSGRPAMMAPSPFEPSGDPTVGDIPVDEPTHLDIAEYNRVRGGTR